MLKEKMKHSAAGVKTFCQYFVTQGEEIFITHFDIVTPIRKTEVNALALKSRRIASNVIPYKLPIPLFCIVRQDVVNKVPL